MYHHTQLVFLYQIIIVYSHKVYKCVSANVAQLVTIVKEGAMAEWVPISFYFFLLKKQKLGTPTF